LISAISAYALVNILIHIVEQGPVLIGGSRHDEAFHPPPVGRRLTWPAQVISTTY
jgi:hypothetical protein